MKVFISWSGDLSRQLAEAIREWLPGVLQSVKPFFTPSDIEKGARWGTDIAQELEASAFGIFCLTKWNLTKPWIMFEAGALAKRISTSRVCPILFGVDSSELQGPLVQFQASPFNQTEIRKLVASMNANLGELRLAESVLNNVFDMWWPKLDEKVKAIMSEHSDGDKASDARTDRELLEEILGLSRLGVRSRRPNPEEEMQMVAALEALADITEALADAELLTHFKPLGDLYESLRNLSRQMPVGGRASQELMYLNDRIVTALGKMF